MPGKDGSVPIDFMLWVAGTLIAIVVFVAIIWPWVLSFWYGGCWSDARTDIRDLGSEIETGIRSDNPGQFVRYRLSVGDCIGGVAFINGREDPAYSGFIQKECEEYSGYKSYMILFPKEYMLAKDDEYQKGLDEELEEKIDNLKDAMSYWEAFKLWVKEKTGRVPPVYCYELEHAISEDSIKSLPEGFYQDPFTESNWNSGTDYCMLITPRPTSSPGDFNYDIESITCPPRESPEEEE